ncbi:MAG: glycine dehydrogenase (aminomethyl-transferring) [Elusimicrobia bacterium RIFCSPLOWO2_01_FULL_59_12]|nr:MAG: glycine dehydrogenase (aminomethyl-transferring) [Elusimicrobia bacterium RIFCSPLOWO2_01_FULL_59_12]
MDFIPHTDAERQEMLAAIGVKKFEDLVKHLPLYRQEMAIPAGLAEGEVLRIAHELASKNKAPGKLLSFLGAGAYDHFSPSAIPALMSRGEFLTSYTPYQPEVSQGTLQTLYEFQSMICELMAMEICNAGMYEGASALAEAVLLALRETGRKEVLIPRTLHPDYRAVLTTYTSEMDIKLVEIPHIQGLLDIDFIKKNLSERTAAIVVQNPNFFGCLEPVRELGPAARAVGALFIAAVNPISLGLVIPPGEYDADIAVAEGQPLGIPVGYGGPYLGLFTCKEKWLRKMPGRLVGQTTDVDGKRAFVLTLQAREQHIRREKATSNVCTTTALVAECSTFYMALLGKQGVRDMASQNLAKSHYAFDQLKQIPGVRVPFNAPFFNEFVLQTKLPAETLQERLTKQDILGGLSLKKWYPELDNASLWCVTETKTKADIDHLVRALKEALG